MFYLFDVVVLLLPEADGSVRAGEVNHIIIDLVSYTIDQGRF